MPGLKMKPAGVTFAAASGEPSDLGSPAPPTVNPRGAAPQRPCRVSVHSMDEHTALLFRDKAFDNLAEDGDGQLVYLAPTRVNLSLAEERHPDVRFLATREHGIYD